MPMYDFKCEQCGAVYEKIVKSDETRTFCPKCPGIGQRQLSAPMGRVAGQVVEGGGPDRFTADALGIPLRDLPAGLRTKR